MQFTDFLKRLNEHLGDHQLPIRESWDKASRIVEEDAVHYELMRDIISGIFRASGCSNGSHPVRLEPTLDWLGEVNHRLLEGDTPDIESIRLVQQIGETSVRVLSSGSDHGIGDGNRRRSG